VKCANDAYNKVIGLHQKYEGPLMKHGNMYTLYAFCRENNNDIEADLTRLLHRVTKADVDEQPRKKVHDISTAMVVNYTSLCMLKRRPRLNKP